MKKNKTTTKDNKENVKSLALKAKVTRSQDSDDCIEGSDEEEMNNEEFNLMAKNFRKFFRRGGKFQRRSRLRSRTNDRRNKDAKISRADQGSKREDGCFDCGEKDYFVSDCPKPRHYKAFVGDVWSDDEEGNQETRKQHVLWRLSLMRYNITLLLAKILL